jgi:hypothetical protein
METMILVPGPQGSWLTLNGEEIWPPTVEEMIVGYHRMNKLLDQNAQFSTIVDKIEFFRAYQQLQDDLQTIANQSNGTKSRLDFPYDWRKDLLKTAERLASVIKDCVDNGSNSITLVCHSGGNLVARALLEGPKYKNESWFGNITKYVGICGPHFGVPRILEYALGLKGSMGISPSDMYTGAKDPNFPSCYQFLPFDGYGVLWDFRQTPPVEVNFYTTATNPPLFQQNLDAAIALQQTIGFNKKPPTVQYILIAGSEHWTDETVNYLGGQSYDPEGDFAGDGMIPIQSSTHSPLPVFVTPGDHIGIFKSYLFRSKLYEVLTDKQLSAKLSRADKKGASLSLNDVVLSPGEKIQLLIIPDLATDAISGSLEIARRDEKLKKFRRYRSSSLKYEGPQIRFISAQIRAPEKPGAYLIRLKGEKHRTTDKTSAGFVVQKSADLKRRKDDGLR